MNNDGKEKMDLNLWLSQKYRLIGSNPTVIAGVGRDDLARWFGEWGFTEGVEVGTFQGNYAGVLCASNPKLHLTCVDPWVCYDGYEEYVNQQWKLNAAYHRAQQRLANYNCTLVRQYSAVASEGIPDGSLDFVYLDGNHLLPYVIQDQYCWVPKVRKGGVVAGHDYLWFDWMTGIQVVEAVDAYTKANRIKQWYVLGRQRRPTTNPRKLTQYARSWMWVK